MTTVAYAALETAIRRAKLAVAPAELHGSVTGYLCAGWGGSAHALLAALALEADDAGVSNDLHGLLDRLAAETSLAMREHRPVVPLLPSGSLQVRADAMVDWCRGFLGGLGLTGVLEDPPPAVREWLADFGHISAMHVASDDDDESSLDEVLDFIAAGVAGLHAALAPRKTP